MLHLQPKIYASAASVLLPADGYIHYQIYKRPLRLRKIELILTKVDPCPRRRFPLYIFPLADHLREARRMKDHQAFNFDDDYGDIYDEIARAVIPAYGQLFQMTDALLGARLAAAAHVLVVGCGSGGELAGLAPAHPQWRFTGVDPSSAMLKRSAAVVERLGASARVALFHGQVEALDTEARFDAATLLNVLHFLPDDGAKEHLLRQIAARLQAGAPLVLVDLHGDPQSAQFALLNNAWGRFMEARGLTGSAKEGFLQRVEKGIAYVPEERIIELCRAAGLRHEARWFTGLLYGGWLFAKD